MKLKLKALAAASMLACLCGQTVASEYMMTVPLKEKMSSWSKASSLYTNWIKDGALYDCSSWLPSSSSVDYGQTYLQSRDCSQKETRIETTRSYDQFANRYQNTGEIEHSRIVPESESQDAIGTRNFVSGSSSGAWGAWSNDGSLHSCSAWSPDASTVNSGTSFTQTRSCSQNQKRMRTHYEVWADGTQTVDHIETDTQTVAVSDSRASTGTKPTTECRFDQAAGYAYNRASGSTNFVAVSWAGENVKFSNAIITSFTHNGYSYWRGSFQKTVNGDWGIISNFYTICRKKI